MPDSDKGCDAGGQRRSASEIVALEEARRYTQRIRVGRSH
jgi:hypothetical protein